MAAAFAHTAVLAGRPGNAEPLAEAGRFFGRLAHLIDAVEDLPADRAAGAYNPLLATGTTRGEARRHCDDPLHGMRLALADLDLEDRRLVKALLDREARRSVDRVFAAYGPPQGPQGPYDQGGYPPPQYPGQPPMGAGGGGWGAGGGGGGGGWHGGHQGRPQRPGLPIPCFTGTLVCVTCGLYQPEWSTYRRRSAGDRCWCARHCDGSCNCCDCCDCCDCS